MNTTLTDHVTKALTKAPATPRKNIFARYR